MANCTPKFAAVAHGLLMQTRRAPAARRLMTSKLSPGAGSTELGNWVPIPVSEKASTCPLAAPVVLSSASVVDGAVFKVMEAGEGRTFAALCGRICQGTC